MKTTLKYRFIISIITCSLFTSLSAHAQQQSPIQNQTLAATLAQQEALKLLVFTTLLNSKLPNPKELKIYPRVNSSMLVVDGLKGVALLGSGYLLGVFLPGSINGNADPAAGSVPLLQMVGIAFAIGGVTTLYDVYQKATGTDQERIHARMVRDRKISELVGFTGDLYALTSDQRAKLKIAMINEFERRGRISDVVELMRESQIITKEQSDVAMQFRKTFDQISYSKMSDGSIVAGLKQNRDTIKQLRIVVQEMINSGKISKIEDVNIASALLKEADRKLLIIEGLTGH